MTFDEWWAKEHHNKNTTMPDIMGVAMKEFAKQAWEAAYYAAYTEGYQYAVNYAYEENCWK